MKSFETGLRDDIIAANLRPLLRLPELTDEDLMKHVNELMRKGKISLPVSDVPELTRVT